MLGEAARPIDTRIPSRSSARASRSAIEPTSSAPVRGSSSASSSPPSRPRGIRRTSMAAGDRGCLAQHAIAMGMTVLVVELLEVVDVDDEHAERRLVAPRRALGRRGLAVEDARIREPGQRVVVGHVADALEQLRLLQRHGRL